MGPSRSSKRRRSRTGDRVLSPLVLAGVANELVFPYSEAMEVPFTPEQQARLAQIATKAGTAPERLVTSVVARYLEEEARFLAAMEKGLAAAERGEFIDEEEMDARLQAM